MEAIPGFLRTCSDRLLEFSKGADSLGKVFFVDYGFVAYLEPVVVNGLSRTVQEIGYLYAVGDAKAYKGVDAQLGIEQFTLLGHYALVVLQQ